MNKKVILIIVLVCIISMIVFLFINNYKLNSKNNNIENKEKGNILVVYFSATGNTKKVAQKIADNLNCELFEIEPEDEYTSEDLDWTNENSRVSREHEDEKLRDVKLKNSKIDNWDSYDTILIGFPIWWGVAAWPVDTFVKNNDFTGKNVIPFCTSSSSGLGNSANLLESKSNGGNWKEGYRFTSSPSDSDIKSFTDNIK